MKQEAVLDYAQDCCNCEVLPRIFTRAITGTYGLQ